MTNNRKLIATCAAFALPLTCAACGDHDDVATAASNAPATEPPATEPPATELSPGAADAVIELAMVDFAFGGVPETVPAGTRVSVSNLSDSELHEVVVFRLPDDEGRAVAELAELPPNDLLAALGEPHAVLLAAPGGPEIPAVGDGVLTEPGRYALFCFIPTGADVDEYLTAAATSDGPPEVDGGPPHFVHGMYAELTVLP